MLEERKEMPSEFGCEVCPELCEQAAINGSIGNVCGYGWQKYSAKYMTLFETRPTLKL